LSIFDETSLIRVAVSRSPTESRPANRNATSAFARRETENLGQEEKLNRSNSHENCFHKNASQQIFLAPREPQR